MQKVILALLLLFFSGTFTRAQIGFQYLPGFIITNDNDTITGFIRDRGGVSNSRGCFFRRVRSGETEKYLPGEIKAFVIIDEKYYESFEIYIKGEPKQFFLEVLVKGNTSLYHLYKSTSLDYLINNRKKNYYIQTPDGTLVELANEKVKDESVAPGIDILNIEYDKKEFQQSVYIITLTSLFSDGRNTQKYIPQVAYNKSSFIDILKVYLKETCGTDCLSYRKDLKYTKRQYGLYSGISFTGISFLSTRAFNYTTEKPLNQQTNVLISVPFGAFLNFPLSFIKDNVSFQTEFNTVGVKFNQIIPGTSYFYDVSVSYRQYGLALQLKYEFLQRNLFSPSIAIGLNKGVVLKSDIALDGPARSYVVNHFQKGGWFLEFGMDFKVNTDYSLFSNLRIYSLNNFIVNKALKYHAYNNIANDFAYALEYRANIGALLIGLKF